MAELGKNGSGSISHDENAVKTPRKRGCMGHCKRFWWVWLLVFGVLVAIIVPVIIFVAVPKIAQDKINQASLEVTSIRMSQSQTNSFTMAIDSIIRTDGSVHAEIDAFEGEMFLTDLPVRRPFARINFPKTTSDAYQEVKVSQSTPIFDMEAFTTFNTWLLSNETLRVSVEGRTNVRVRGLSNSYGVNFAKTISMPGIQNFAGTTVSQPKVTATNDTLGNNFQGITTIPNRSIVTFEIGNITFHNYFLDAEVGTVFLDNVTLKPGNNTMPMRASIDPLTVVTNINKEPYCKDGVMPFKLRGKTVVNNGQPLPYFADSLATANQTVSIGLKEALAVLNIKVECGGGH